MAITEVNKMDSWVLKQLRAFILTDLKDYIPSGYFERESEIVNLSTSLASSEYLSFELKWGKSAAELGRKLYFQPPTGLTARQVSASELLMNLGMLSATEAMLSATTQISEKAVSHNIPDCNTGNVAAQLKNSHVPTLQNNIAGALEQYVQHLTYEEAKPYICLLAESKQAEFNLMNKNNSKTINNHINVSGSVNGIIQAGESNTQTKNENLVSPQRNSILTWLLSNLGKVVFSLISAALIAWLGLK